jgi:transcription elongation factor GreA
MPASELMQLAQAGDYDTFEARCLELLEAGQITLAQLVGPFRQLDKAGQASRVTTLTQMVLDLVPPDDDPESALAIACIALVGSPNDANLRTLTADLYRRVHGETPGFDVILSASGITGGRPVRMALKLLDLCLTLKPGDALLSRMDDRVVEVTAVDRENGLFTLRQAGRVTTRPAPEVVREFELVAPDDFRVMRALRPDQLADLIQSDPVAVVVGLIHAHGEHIDADVLKHELVPRYIDAADWSNWWSKARTKLRRSPNITIEGRSPMILTYNIEGRSLEEETWESIQTTRDLGRWMSLVESYIRECKSRKATPDAALLQRTHNHFTAYISEIRELRPGEALACALAINRLEEKGLPVTDESRSIATEMLRTAPQPSNLLAELDHDDLRERGLAALREARPEESVRCAVAWMRTAPASMLDSLSAVAIEAGRADDVQGFIDAGLGEPADHPELIYWLWKGPKHKKSLNLPSDDELFRLILDELSALGRTVSADAGVVKEFRHRMKSALALRSYAKATKCLESCSEAAGITFRRQFERLEGMGDNVRAKLLDALRTAHPVLWAVKPKRRAPWEDEDTLWCTSQGLARRTAERDEIINVKMHENAKRIGEAASHGDLSENSEYTFALEERDFLRAQLATANEELSKARVLTVHDIPDDHVGIGTRVRLQQLDDQSERVMTFLGPFETDVDKGIFSYFAPVSQTLMGRREGDRVTLTVDGCEVEFAIKSVANSFATDA